MNKIQKRNLIIAAIFALIVFMFFKKSSGYDLPKFTVGMSGADATKLYDSAVNAINEENKTKSEIAISQGTPEKAREFGLEAQKAQSDLSLEYNKYMMSITPVSKTMT